MSDGYGPLLVGAPIWGLISDRMGRPRILLFGPGLNAVADALAAAFSNGVALAALSTRIVIALSVLLGATMMLGLALTLPANEGTPDSDAINAPASAPAGFAALWSLSVAVNLVLSGFELGIVLQGRQHAELSTQQVALMFAECSLVMLGINAPLLKRTKLAGIKSAKPKAAVSTAPAVAGATA